MPIYFLICVQEQNQDYMLVHRILKSIPTTTEEIRKPHSASYEEMLKMQASNPYIYQMIVSRNEDLSFIEKESNHNSGTPAAAAYH